MQRKKEKMVELLEIVELLAGGRIPKSEEKEEGRLAQKVRDVREENVEEVTDPASSFGSKNTKMMRGRKLGLETVQPEGYGE